MDRFLTDEELTKLELGELIFDVGCIIQENIEKGELKGCTLYRPLITDGPVVGVINDLLNEKGDYMYYLQIKGTSDCIKEAGVIKPIISDINEGIDKILKDSDGRIVFNTGKELLAVNCVTTKHNGEYYHIIVFLMRNSESYDNYSTDSLNADNLDTNIVS